MTFVNENYYNSLSFEEQTLTELFAFLVEEHGLCRKLARVDAPVFLHQSTMGDKTVRMSFTCRWFSVESLLDIKQAGAYNDKVEFIPYDIVNEWKDRYVLLYAVKKVNGIYRIFFVNSNELQNQ